MGQLQDQKSADVVWWKYKLLLSDFGKRINSYLCPVFVEAKPPSINQQCLVYAFKCDLCDADCVGYTRPHLFQYTDEHKHFAIGKHLRVTLNQRNKEQFTTLKKCCGKLECIIYKMLFIQQKKPKLNTQPDSIKTKLFRTYIVNLFYFYSF